MEEWERDGVRYWERVRRRERTREEAGGKREREKKREYQGEYTDKKQRPEWVACNKYLLVDVNCVVQFCVCIAFYDNSIIKFTDNNGQKWSEIKCVENVGCREQ